MIRQAQTYFVGAVSGTTVVAAAVVAFVMLVSFQALRDWPLAGLGLGGDSGNDAVLSSGRAAGPAGSKAASTAAGKASQIPGGRTHSKQSGNNGADVGDLIQANSASPDATVPGSTSPSPAAGGGSSPSGPASGAASSGGSGGSGNGGGGGSPGSPGGGGSGEGGSGSSISGTVTGAVDNTVSGVDEVTGGALGDSGVTPATEEVVEGVAGPGSPVGETIDGTAEKVKETVGGLLGR